MADGEGSVHTKLKTAYLKKTQTAVRVALGPTLLYEIMEFYFSIIYVKLYILWNLSSNIKVIKCKNFIIFNSYEAEIICHCVPQFFSLQEFFLRLIFCVSKC